MMRHSSAEPLVDRTLEAPPVTPAPGAFAYCLLRELRHPAECLNGLGANQNDIVSDGSRRPAANSRSADQKTWMHASRSCNLQSSRQDLSGYIPKLLAYPGLSG